MSSKLKVTGWIIVLAPMLLGFVDCGSSLPALAADNPSNKSDIMNIANSLHTGMSPEEVISKMGKPNEIGGSGILIYYYRTEANETIACGFAHYRLKYAHVLAANGNILRDIL